MWSWVSHDSVETADRTEWFNDMIARTVAPHRMELVDPATFHARTGVLELGRVSVAYHDYGAQRSWRTPELIRRSDPEHYFLGLLTGGGMRVDQGRNEARLTAGDAVLFDTSHPYSAGTTSPGGSRVLLMSIPRTVVNLPADRVDAALAQGFAAREGIGAILRRFLGSLREHAGACSPQELESLERSTVSLASALIAQQLDAWEALSAETREEILLRRVHAFIEHHLDDPGLSPEAVAAHHHISLRGLYSLFSAEEESVAARIRRRRLERCRAELAASRPPQPIRAIAARWGFTSDTAFSRTFKAAYGISPRAFRRQAAAQHGQLTPPAETGPPRHRPRRRAPGAESGSGVPLRTVGSGGRG
ncbi:AraC family transcriptional regulator [Streptomyces qinzhouensis]|uniref:AraC family transcriptional regulator n=1 Tax=Streptomyces qinzhouensis TaxID=2599401 RepID=A0A5B8IM64_9ACTN|nr:AraC family transcriptional regulator [Streptomyces qinzhouensis]QDY79682.1 AraC family transcriptional regulator [Streptomyces qinzhouensis]